MAGSAHDRSSTPHHVGGRRKPFRTAPTASLQGSSTDLLVVRCVVVNGPRRRDLCHEDPRYLRPVFQLAASRARPAPISTRSVERNSLGRSPGRRGSRRRYAVGRRHLTIVHNGEPQANLAEAEELDVLYDMVGVILDGARSGHGCQAATTT